MTDTTKVYTDIAQKIIEHQEIIIGPVAIQQAEQVDGLSLDWAQHAVVLVGNEKDVINDLIEQYRELFGQIAVEVSKDAVSSIASQLSAQEMPDLLK